MKFISSRDKSIRISSSEAIIKGISEDGGLFVPEYFPQIKDLNLLKDKDYKELAFIVMKEFLTDFEPNILKEIIEKAYDNKFSDKDIAPIKKIGDEFILELFHGPTLAFKDMALSILPYLMKEAMKINGIKKEVVILTATSGDTGKAALEGFANIDGIKIIVFFPEDGVSMIQKLQMKTQEGENTFVVGINGNFDDAQSGVKDIFADKEFNELLNENGYILSSANSINIGRLIPQIVYYFFSYLSLLKNGYISDFEKVNIVVPTGNFGNILAAFYAKNMGLPVNKLICASNENNVLTEFFDTKIYDRRKDLLLTSSPSMDILISSNLERLLFHLSNNDDKLISDKMDRLKSHGVFDFKDFDLGEFYAGYSTEDEVGETIEKTFKKENYLLDPHTAVAYNVYKKYKCATKDNTKSIIASTASPFKFPIKVASSIGMDTRDKDEFEIIYDLGEKANINIPSAITGLRDKDIIHNNNSNKEDIKNYIKGFLKAGVKHD